MNFFSHQDRAKQNTTKLVALFVLGVLSLIVTVTLIIIVALMFTDIDAANEINKGNYSIIFHEQNLLLLGGIAAFVIAIVLLGTLTRSLQLRGGGEAVAQALGARLIHPNTNDPDERRVLNVVEEMAIASGTPVPPVFMVDDDSINAFAAGYHQKDAVIGVTRGCVKLLNREELQGVIAHEFSHILHGDMRLNIRLVSWLYGIVLIGLIGGFILRSAAYSSMGRRRNKNDGLPVALIIGLGMMVVGYAGSFFGGLIRSAVSRQREYLADASAVQYTRNPQGIANALKKIGANAHGSQVQNPNASEFSHMFFAHAVKSKLGGLGATHPPLQDRIKRVQPSWDGKYPDLSIEAKHQSQNQQSQTQSRSNQEDLRKLFAMAGAAVSKQKALDSLEKAGELEDENIEDANAMLESLDTKLYELAHEPLFARVIVYALLLSKDEQVQKLQKEAIDQKLLQLPESQYIFEKIEDLDIKLFIVLLELLIPALKELSKNQFNAFKQVLHELIKADQKISFFEWSLYNIVVKNVEGIKYSSQSYKLNQCQDQVRILLSMLAYAGQKSEDVASAFDLAYKSLDLSKDSHVLEQKDLSFKDLDRALSKLVNLKPMQKLQLMRSMIECVSYNEKIDQTELQLLKAVADSIDVVLPPMVR